MKGSSLTVDLIDAETFENRLLIPLLIRMICMVSLGSFMDWIGPPLVPTAVMMMMTTMMMMMMTMTIMMMIWTRMI